MVITSRPASSGSRLQPTASAKLGTAALCDVHRHPLVNLRQVPLTDIPRMTPKPAWRVAILQRPWKPDGRYGWLPAARAARETPSALTFPVTQDIIVATLTGYDRTCSLPERSSSFFSSLHRNNRHMIGKPLSSKEGEYLPC